MDVVGGVGRPSDAGYEPMQTPPQPESSPPPFDVIAVVEGPTTVLLLRGSVALGTAPDLTAVLDATIERHPASLVLDMSELDFIGVAGLVAVLNAERRCAALGIDLSLRSPSALLDRLLPVMTRTPQVEAAGDAGLSQRPEESGETYFVGAPGSLGIGDDLHRVSALPADPAVVDGALRLLVDLALSRITLADGVSVSLLRHGRISTVAASDQTIMDMDANQYATGEGPCLDASLQGRVFYADVLAGEARWPSFTPRAMGLGISAILSSPLTASDAPVGALNIYSRTPSAFDVKAHATAAAFANQASVILSDAGAGVTDAQMATTFQAALRSRELITLAQGRMMEREGIDEARAFVALLRMSLDKGLPLRGLAESIVFASHPPVGALQWEADV